MVIIFISRYAAASYCALFSESCSSSFVVTSTALYSYQKMKCPFRPRAVEFAIFGDLPADSLPCLSHRSCSLFFRFCFICGMNLRFSLVPPYPPHQVGSVVPALSPSLRGDENREFMGKVA